MTERRSAPSAPLPARSASRAVGPVGILALDRAAALSACEAALEHDGLTRLAFANAHCVNTARTDARYRHALEAFLVLPDGIGVDLASRILHGAAFPANLNGTDFVPALLAHVERPLAVALIGGEDGIAERAAAALSAAFPRHRFVVVSHGFFQEAEEKQRVLDRLAAERVDMTLIALGVPRQEFFIAEDLDDRHGRLAIGVGALFDFLAGKVPRAPTWIRELRLEWLYRLGLEPRRLARRYVMGNPRFLAHVLAERLRRG